MTATDELRGYALSVRNVALRTTSLCHGARRDLLDSAVRMEQAADTIESLRDKLNAALGAGRLTAEQVREIVDKHWHDLPTDYDMPEATALPEYSYDWHAIADKLNALVGLDNGVERSSNGVTRYSELFGTPERAARTFADFCDDCDKGECNDCPLDRLTDFCIGYDDLIEWLRGDAE